MISCPSAVRLRQGFGAIHRLVSIVGRSAALDVLGSSRVVSATEAARLGLVDHVCPHDCTLSAQNMLVPFLRQKYPGAVREIKSIIAEIDDEGGDRFRSIEKEGFSRRWFSEDNRHALKAK